MRLGFRIHRICLVTVLCLAAAWPSFADTIVVQMTSVDFTPVFVPNDLTVRPGDTVRFVNVDPFLLDHSTCSGTGSADPVAGALWNSGTVHSGAWFEHVFNDIGDFAFFSIPHEFEGMFGVIRVTPSLNTGGEIESATWGQVKSFFRNVLPRE